MIYPQPLAKGDKIAIVSPASRIYPEYVDGACRVIREMGYEPVPYPHCKGCVAGYSGSIEERLADFRDAMLNPEIKAVLCSRGGYGVVHLLEFLDAEELSSNAKWVVGFSDISALHAAMVSAGVVSVHGSMAKHMALHGADEVTSAIFSILQGKLPTYEVPAHELNKAGVAEGRLAGGNLAVLSGLTDTPFDLLAKGDVLFIEDIGEPIYKVERILYNLRLSGVLSMIKGLVVGQFTNCESPDGTGETMEQMIRRMVDGYDMPVAFNFPCGHVDYNLPLIEGAKVKLEVGESALLQFIPE